MILELGILVLGIFVFIIISFFAFSMFINWLSKFNIGIGNMKKIKELIYSYQYMGGSYGGIHRIINASKQTILNVIRKNHTNYISIHSYYNGNYYQIYDIDNEENINHININYPYVVIMSSNSYPNTPPGNITLPKEKHYWILVDNPTKKWKNLLNDDNWYVLSDENYVKFTNKKGFYIRAFYKDIEHKPILVKELSQTENASEDFKEFVNKIFQHYEDFGLQISVNITKDKKLLDIYNRCRKLERIINK